MKMGRQVGDVAARLVPDGRDADVARPIVTASRLPFGEEGADASAPIEAVLAQGEAVVGAERVDQIAGAAPLPLRCLSVHAVVGGCADSHMRAGYPVTIEPD